MIETRTKKKLSYLYIFCTFLLAIGCSSGGIKQAKNNKSSFDSRKGGEWGSEKLSQEQLRRLSEAYHRNNDVVFLKEVESLMAQDKKNLKVLNLLALYHLRKKRTGLAETILARALADHPNSSTIYNNLGLIKLSKGDQRLGIENFQKALRINPQNFVANMNLASLYVTNEAYEKAMPLLKRAYRQKPKDLSVLSQYGLSLMKIGNLSLAKRVYRSAIGLGIDIENHINYVILLVDYLSDSKMGLREIEKIRLRGPSLKQLKILGELEKKARKK